MDFGSDGRGFDSLHRRSYFSAPDIFFNYNIYDIFSILSKKISKKIIRHK